MYVLIQRIHSAIRQFLLGPLLLVAFRKLQLKLPSASKRHDVGRINPSPQRAQSRHVLPIHIFQGRAKRCIIWVDGRMTKRCLTKCDGRVVNIRSTRMNRMFNIRIEFGRSPCIAQEEWLKRDVPHWGVCCFPRIMGINGREKYFSTASCCNRAFIGKFLSPEL